MQIRSFRRSGEPVWVNALLLKCARLFGTRPAHCGQRPHLPHQQAGHVTVSVSTTKKPIRWTTRVPIGQRSFSRVCAARRLASITTLPVRTFCGMLKRGLGEGTTAVCRTVSKSTASQLCLRSVARQLILVAIGSGTSKDVHA